MQHVATHSADSASLLVVAGRFVFGCLVRVGSGRVGSVLESGWVGFRVGFWSFRDRASSFFTLSGEFWVQNSLSVAICRIVALGVALESFLRPLQAP